MADQINLANDQQRAILDAAATLPEARQGPVLAGLRFGDVDARLNTLRASVLERHAQEQQFLAGLRGRIDAVAGRLQTLVQEFARTGAMLDGLRRCVSAGPLPAPDETQIRDEQAAQLEALLNNLGTWLTALINQLDAINEAAAAPAATQQERAETETAMGRAEQGAEEATGALAQLQQAIERVQTLEPCAQHEGMGYDREGGTGGTGLGPLTPQAAADSTQGTTDSPQGNPFGETDASAIERGRAAQQRTHLERIRQRAAAMGPPADEVHNPVVGAAASADQGGTHSGGRRRRTRRGGYTYSRSPKRSTRRSSAHKVKKNTPTRTRTRTRRRKRRRRRTYTRSRR